jgi:hypothetical protein
MGSEYLGRKVQDTKYSTIIVETPKIRRTLKPYLKRKSLQQTVAVALTNKNDTINNN